MPIVGDVYEVKLFGRWQSQEETLNVYHFAVKSIFGAAYLSLQLIAKFQTDHVEKNNAVYAWQSGLLLNFRL